MLVHMPKETNTRMWTAALPGIAKAICYPRQKQTGVWEWLNELMCLHGGTLCSTAASSPLCASVSWEAFKRYRCLDLFSRDFDLIGLGSLFQNSQGFQVDNH